MLPIWHYRIKLLFSVYSYIVSHLIFIGIFQVTEQDEEFDDQFYLDRMIDILYGIKAARGEDGIRRCECHSCAKLHLLKLINYRLSKYFSESLADGRFYPQISKVIEDFKIDLIAKKYRMLLLESSYLTHLDVRHHSTYTTLAGSRYCRNTLYKELQREVETYLTSMNTLTKKCQTWFKTDVQHENEFLQTTLIGIEDVENVMRDYDPVDLFDSIEVVAEKYYVIKSHYEKIKTCLRCLSIFENRYNFAFYGMGQNSLSSETSLMERIRCTRQRMFFLREFVILLLFKTRCLFYAKTSVDYSASFMFNRTRLGQCSKSKNASTSTDYRDSWIMVLVMFAPSLALVQIPFVCFLLAFLLEYIIIDETLCKLRLVSWF